MYLLGNCPNLTTLILDHKCIKDGPEIPSALHKARIWLSGCKSLRKLEVSNRYGPTFATGVLMDENIPVRSLKVTPDTRGYSKTFYEALSTKSSLRELRVRCLEDYGSDRRDNHLWESILSMNSLQSLLITASWLEDDDIKMITKRLNQLQCLEIGNYDSTNAIWDYLSGMPTLRTFIQKGASDFTLKGISSYIQKLGPGNRGFHLELNSPTRTFTEEEMSFLRSLLRSRVDGTIDIFYDSLFMLGRVPVLD